MSSHPSPISAQATAVRDGIHVIDTGQERPLFAAAYLIEGDGRAAFVDCGTNYSVPRLLDAVRESGMTPDQVDWLILTHVHLDHAGGAGALLQHLPNARVVVHPRGVRHMIDPAKLQAGAAAVYGEAVMQATYGALVPIPAERVVEASDGHVVELAGRRLTCLDAPGHARHHIVIHDAKANVFFTGDTFGIAYRELADDTGDFIFPTTSPVQFDADALHASIDRMLSYQPAAMYLTHYGRVENVTTRAAELHELIDTFTAIARHHRNTRERHAAIRDDIAAWFVEHLSARNPELTPDRVHELLAIDIDLNAQGLEIWLDQQDDT